MFASRLRGFECRFYTLLIPSSIDLPDDVFEPGEVKPTKPVKRKAPAANGNPAMKKRSSSDVGAGDRSNARHGSIMPIYHLGCVSRPLCRSGDADPLRRKIRTRHPSDSSKPRSQPPLAAAGEHPCFAQR